MSNSKSSSRRSAAHERIVKKGAEIPGIQPVFVKPNPGTDPDPGTSPNVGTNPDPGTGSNPGTDPDPGTSPNVGTNPDPGTTPGTSGADSSK